MTYWLLMSAALVALVGAAFHGVVGHRVYYAQNIKGSNLAQQSQSLSLVSWHIFTIFLLVCAATLVYVAYAPSAVVAVYPMIAINLFGAIMFLALAVFGGHKVLLRLPGAYLMGATAALAWFAVA